MGRSIHFLKALFKTSLKRLGAVAVRVVKTWHTKENCFATKTMKHGVN